MAAGPNPQHHIKGGGEYRTGDVLAFSVHPETGDITLHPLGWMGKPVIVIRQRDWFQFRNTVDEEQAVIAERHGG